MKREEIKAIFPDATDEQLDKVMGINGSDVEKAKAKTTALEAEIKDKKEAFDTLNAEFEKLKTAGASAEDWKTKFETLQAENDEKAKKAEADRILKEKSASIENRFNVCVGEKEFAHEAIRADYLRKFSEALENKDFEGKSDKDILHALSKDDGNAWKGPVIVKLAGGTSKASLSKTPTKEEFQKMSYAQKLELYNTNKELYDELKE